MKFHHILFISLFASGALFHGQAAEEPGIIPRPQAVTIETEQPAFRAGVHPGAVTSDKSEAAQQAAGFLKSEFPKLPGAMELVTNPELDREAYRLAVGESGIRLEASDYAGFFNGSRTLNQLFRQMKNGELPAMTITDAPRFKWRGVMLDVARHYFKPEFLYLLVDQLAAAKMNVLHLHLTDDQGWRIEIKKYPLLTGKGAWRSNIRTFDLPWLDEVSDNYRADSMYGGFYTQDELKKLVAYAAERNVTIVPEIDIPGHSRAAIAAYPELLKCDISGDSNVYCAGNDSCYVFLEQVLSEVFDIFPSKYIIIGADEVRTKSWQACPRCQKLFREKGFKDKEMRELQYCFVTRVADFCRSKGRMPTGWDQIVEGGAVIPEVAVIHYLNPGAGFKPAEQGREMIIAQTEYCYFDYSHGPGEPFSIGPGPLWEKTYSLVPVPDTLAADKRRFILGVEGALWTEFVPNEGHAAYMIFPRALALAEAGWTQPERKDEADFRRRLQGYLPYLDEQGVSYRPDGGLVAISEQDGIISLSTPIPDAEIYYTLDRQPPTGKSTRYTKPFAIDNLTNLKVAVFGRKGNSFPLVTRTVGIGKWSIRAPESMPEEPAESAFDGEFGTCYRSKKVFRKDDEIRMDFEQPRQISGMRVVAAHGLAGGRKEFLAAGRLLVSSDGTNFTEAAEFENGVADFQNVPMTVKAVRIVADEPVEPRLKVREIFFFR